VTSADRLPMPTQPDGLAPFVILQRTDGKIIVYDARRPPGHRARWIGDDVVAAVAACRGELGGELTGRTEVLIVAGEAPSVRGLR
jgi:hypothetical protein